jgi:hypothetical protein
MVIGLRFEARFPTPAWEERRAVAVKAAFAGICRRVHRSPGAAIAGPVNLRRQSRSDGSAEAGQIGQRSQVALSLRAHGTAPQCGANETGSYRAEGRVTQSPSPGDCNCRAKRAVKSEAPATLASGLHDLGLTASDAARGIARVDHQGRVLDDEAVVVRRVVGGD